MWQDQCKEFVDAVMFEHKDAADGYEYAASALVDYLVEHETPERRVVMYEFTYLLNAMVKVVDSVEDEYCYCCGRRSVVVQSCPQCGELVCQDCARPFGGHVCGLD